MSSDIAIKVENLSKSYLIYDAPRDRLKQFVVPRLQRAAGLSPKQYYREFWALKDVSFEVKKGETVGIIGRNGSGKSTLLQIICGTLNPTAGSVTTNGRIAALLELGSGFNPEFTGRENVYMSCALFGLTKEEIDNLFDDIAAFADIGDFIEQPVKTYSSGMLVRLAFASVILVNPAILIVDEALSVGDELFQRKCFSRIEAIRASGATILFVSHSGAQVIELCNRAVLLDAGEKLAVGGPKQIVGHYHKLLYAPTEKIRENREQILLIDKQANRAEIALPIQLTQSISDPDVDLQETYDPSLKPSSTIEYESIGACIKSPAIFTLRGRQVNNLVRGQTYRYRYSVNFTKSASNVRFGMFIKTMSGFELGGIRSSREILIYARANTVYQVEFEFKCVLLAGVYFMNTGVVADIAGSEEYLHRLIDAIAFRVLPESDDKAVGIVDFESSPQIKLLQVEQFEK